MNHEPRGCLAALFGWLGFGRSPWVEPTLPYRLRDDYLSPAELSFYRVLQVAVADRAVLCCKVRLGDVFFVPRGTGSQGWWNRINHKHVDFLLCDPKTMRPRCGIELDDASHDRRDRRDRDAFVDQVFAAAGLPLVHIAAAAAYSAADLDAAVTPHLQDAPFKLAPVRPSEGKPVCPKCGVPMVERTAKRGLTIGRPFFGCPNYPNCRETQAIS